jgi:hypothetical protein
MKMHRLLIVLTVQVAVAAPAPAGIFKGLFKKRQQPSQAPQQSNNPYQQQMNNRYQQQQMKPYEPQPAAPYPTTQAAPATPSPAERLNQMISIAKTDPSESRRAAAIKELRQYDLRTYPQIMGILVDLLQTDSDSSVRAEAAESLGKMRPISQQAGWALQKASTSDSSTRVRWQARAALIQYQMAGYQPRQANQPPQGMPTSAEPPLATPITATPNPAPAVAPPRQVSPPSYIRQPVQNTAEPPMSNPVVNPPAPLVPAQPPRLQRPPSTYDEGPILNFPK